MKRKISLILLSFLGSSFLIASNKFETENQISIGNLKVRPDDVVYMLTKTADAIAKAAQSSREKKENAIKQFQKQLVDLGKQKDLGIIGQSEYDQAARTLNDNIDQLRHQIEAEDKTATTVGDNVQKVVIDGYHVLLDKYKEGERRKTDIALEEERRKTNIAIAAVNKTIENDGKKEQLKMELESAKQKLEYISDPARLKRYALFAAGASAGVAGGYYGFKLLYRFLDQKMNALPLLAFKTSRQSWMGNAKNYIASFFGYKQEPVTLENNIVFAPELEEQLKTIATTTKMIHDKGLPLPSLLLYGPPGTGKTWYAELFAHITGMDYVYTSADRWAQFSEGKDIQELHNLLDWAKSSTKGTIIFIDEIDALGSKRDTLSDRWIKLQNAFLARTGKSCNEFKIIGATNRIWALDDAFKDRFAQVINVPLPGPAERERIIQLYLNKYIINATCSIKQDGKKVEAPLSIDKTITTKVIKEAAHKTEGFSGRKLEQIIEDMRMHCYLTDDLRLTKDIFDAVMTEKIKEFRQIKEAQSPITQTASTFPASMS